jgi:hypothetical protein
MSAPAVKPFTIQEIKEDILRRARERQASIERGEYDVPIHYAPLPLADVWDRITQLEYRCDSLRLAVPPPSPSLGGKLKRFCKQMVCKSLRWLLIRQVEFNLIALEQTRAAAEVSALVDQDLAELMAGLTALKLQIRTLRGRVAYLEGRAAPDEAQVSDGSAGDSSEDYGQECRQAHYIYLDCFKDQGPILVAGCGRGDFLKLLVSEGLPARGTEADWALAEECRERELPVVHTELARYFGQLEDDSLGGIFIGSAIGSDSARDMASLLAQCWTKLRKGGILIVALPNPSFVSVEVVSCPDPSYGWEVPAELLSYLLESQSFTVIDYVFSVPGKPRRTGVSPPVPRPPVQRTSAGLPFDRKRYRHYAIIGRK